MKFIHSREEEVNDGRDGMHEEIEANEKRATAPSSLPDDVVEEIFIRLPVKTIIRLKSLSKQWSLRIKSHSFAEKHLKMASSYQANHPSLMLLPYPITVTGTKIEFNPFSLGGRRRLSSTQLSFPQPFLGWIHSSKSCDGLFCIQSSKSTCVVNPATRWFRYLPPSRYQVLNPTSAELVTAAAFVKAAVDYKLVWLYNSFPNEGVTVTTCEVFDFRANAWRHLTFTPSLRVFGMPESANGSVYWFTEVDNNYKIDVIAFDIHTEKFRLLPNIHPVTSSSVCHSSMCTLDDRLCVLTTTTLLDKEFWRLKSSEDMWEKIFTIDLFSTPLYWIGNESSWTPVTMWKKTKMLLSHPCSMNLVIYNLQTRSVRILNIQPHTVCTPYFESLISHI
ncbi:putative F-box protein At1g12855 [Raphanus sativus]|uniref:F-box protein At1g12855 n=1 Tax=Raphanus sativus TaxID=3726 RepID=A0A6J0JMC8_RAPSA|nr:putative F-box protein At1g12855 [Raphanus sativus]